MLNCVFETFILSRCNVLLFSNPVSTYNENPTDSAFIAGLAPEELLLLLINLELMLLLERSPRALRVFFLIKNLLKLEKQRIGSAFRIRGK